MAMIECPACKGRISSLLSKCPKCGAVQKREPGPPSARRVESETIQWARKWAPIGAWSVIAGFLIPIPLPQFSQDGFTWGALWSWDLFRSETLLPVGLTAPPLAGLALLLLLFLSREELLPRFMTFIGGLTIVVEIALGFYLAFSFVVGELNGEELTLDFAGPFLTCALGSVGAFVIAAGNRVRKTHPIHPWPRRISAFGGILLLLPFAIPWSGRPPIAAFFSGESWKVGWPIMVPMLAFLAYGIAGVLCFRNFRRPRQACRTVSILGRGALLLMPAFFIILNFVTFETMQGRAPGALVVLKAFLTLYGGLVIFAAGLAAVLTMKLKSAPRVELIATPKPVRGFQE